MAEFDRRDFLKLVSVGAGAAAATGCEPVEKLIPYVVQPEVITPGLPVIYASTCRECPAGCGLHVKTREGRPVKLEGNPNHPVNRGALCARGEASLSRNYHPDRISSPMRRREDGEFEPLSWDEAIALLAGKIRAAGSGTYILGDDPGPTLSALIDEFAVTVGAGGRVVYEPFASESSREAVKIVFGVESEPLYDLSQADLVIAFGTDLLETWGSPVEQMRQFAEARAVDDPDKRAARFVSVSPRLSTTTSNADEWIPALPGSEGILALGLARAAIEAGAGTVEDREVLGSLLAPHSPERVAERTGVDAATVKRLGRALVNAESPLALPPGVELTSRRATATAAAVLVLNHVTGAVGRGIQLLPQPETARRRARYREILTLVDAMKSGEVGVLLVHGTNPVFTLPPAAGFEEALDEVPFVVSFASMADETAARADLILPDHSPLESWGDAEPRPGVRSVLQPTVRPIFDTRALGDTLLDTARAVAGAVENLPTGSYRQVVEASFAGSDWRATRARGGTFSRTEPLAEPELAPSAARLDVSEPLLEGDGAYVLLAYPHAFLYDGRSANLPHLQEIPDPATKLAWQSWAEISHATAKRLRVGRGDVLAIETNAGTIQVPAFPRGGIRDDVIAVPIGQGHTVGHYASLAGDQRDGGPRDAAESLKVGAPRGANVIAVLPAATDETGGRAWLTAKASVRATGTYQHLPSSQTTDNQRQRQLAELVPLTALSDASAEGGAGGEHGTDHGGGHEEGHHDPIVPFDPRQDADEASAYRWGMSIDLDRCTGCSACIAACYTENNVSIVGEEEFARGRSMAWLRIERYIGDGDPHEQLLGNQPVVDREALGDTDVRPLPMLCQHCGAAPCEPVCPVFATYHNPEGMNGMVYNRCIGTRYCSNNCSYKVRRFNFWDYSYRNWPGQLGLMLNPDVTVRGKGVMEKCTFCVQRVESARQTAKDEGREIRDGEVVTACQQACPTQAIAFGNLKDEGSRVSKQSADPARGYHALHVLNTRPATTYLSKVRRGPVES
jgi:molybdopterin-containing oxidoreductase family iron-sulfur binding subunit